MDMISGKYIRELREEHGLSQAELARLANISQAHVAKIENERVDPRLSTVNRILSVLSRDENFIACREIMNRHLRYARMDDSMEGVVKIMRRFGISQLPVFHRNRVIGSIRESTIIRNVHRNPKKLKVRDVIENPFPTVNPSDPVDMLPPILDHHQAVLVSEKGKVVGIITKSDLLKI